MVLKLRLSVMRHVIGEGEISGLQELIVTLPESLGGMNFPVESPFPYAASALLSCAVWRERGVLLDVFSLAEATNAFRCGVDNLFSATHR